jgi:Pyruvate/2-oxoacid:ferredoxin oxidoreductase delta subunit
MEGAMAKREGRVEIQVDHCKGCDLCVASCPTSSLEMSEALNKLGYHPAKFLEDTGCTCCGVCFYACPEPAAIIVYEIKKDKD